MTNSNVVIGTVTRQSVAERRAAREAEIDRIGARIAYARGSHKIVLASELIAVLGFIHNTPADRCRWEKQ